MSSPTSPSTPCICRIVRPLNGDGVPHWADVDSYCPVHGTKTAVEHDLDTFPRSLDSYACDECRHGDHVRCRQRIVDVSWSNDCACLSAAKQAHVDVTRRARRERLAETIYATAAEGRTVDFWPATVDGSPNAAAYAIADALIDQGLAR